MCAADLIRDTLIAGMQRGSNIDEHILILIIVFAVLQKLFVGQHPSVREELTLCGMVCLTEMIGCARTQAREQIEEEREK